MTSLACLEVIYEPPQRRYSGVYALPFLTDATLASLRIERMIFHVVGPREEDYVELEEVQPGVHAEFFLDRLRTTAKGLMFDFAANSIVENALRAIEVDSTVFVAQSKALAKQFRIGHSHNASVGAFLIFKLGSEIGTLYALLKFDHEDVLSYAIRRTDHGNEAVIEALPKTIVKSREALQKSALIRLHDNSGELCVQDRSAPSKISTYFQAFLGATRRFTTRELTTQLVEITKRVALDNADVLGKDIIRNISTRIYDAVQHLQSFDVDDNQFAIAIFGPLAQDSPVLRDFHKQLRANRIEDEVFDFDHEAVLRPRQHRLVTQEGVKITYNLQDEHLISRERLQSGRLRISIETAELIEDDIYDDSHPRRS